jgi:putative pyruvate formate lyase activating enzyme
VVSSAFPHFGEEDCLRGSRGSGTIFFSGCSLRCVFCQNADISWLVSGSKHGAADLAATMLALQERGCHNVNLVTPTHVVPQLVQAVAIAAAQGLRLPIVYNSGGYDRAETLALLDGVVDVYMPDFKFWCPGTAARYANADYPGRRAAARSRCSGKVGPLRFGGTASRAAACWSGTSSCPAAEESGAILGGSHELSPVPRQRDGAVPAGVARGRAGRPLPAASLRSTVPRARPRSRPSTRPHARPRRRFDQRRTVAGWSQGG